VKSLAASVLAVAAGAGSCCPLASQGPQPALGPARQVTLEPLPDDAAIVFTSMRWKPGRTEFVPWEVYVMNGDGGNVHRVTHEELGYEHAAVSPDRRLLAAAGVDPRSPESERDFIRLYDLSARTEAAVVPGFWRAGVGGVDWSRDGWLYFVGSPTRERETDVYRLRAGGEELERLTDTPEMESDVSVSEDGTLVAFVRTMRAGKSRKPQIWVMRADGSGERAVYDGGPELGVHGRYPIGAFDPELSPDNAWVVFSRSNTGHDNFGFGAHDICRIRLDGTAFTVLTPPGPIQMIPDWTGDRLLYTEYNESEPFVGIVTMDPDGSRRRRLEPALSQLWDGGRHAKWIPPPDPGWPHLGRGRGNRNVAPGGERAP
jgi:Tol biopolymer transport system component